jgi:hypothetical protein
VIPLEAYIGAGTIDPYANYDPAPMPGYPGLFPVVPPPVIKVFYNQPDCNYPMIAGTQFTGSTAISGMEISVNPPGSLEPIVAPNGTGPGRFQCLICLRWFSRRCRMDACQNSHTNNRPYVCNGQCGEALW